MIRLVRLVAVGTTLVALPLVASTPADAESPSNPWLDRRVLNFAHQGGEIEAPSDTLFALKTAVDKGADVLELDVHATRDGQLVVLHDATVSRTTNGTGQVDEMTLAQIKTLDAAHWFVPSCGTCHDQAASAYTFRGLATADRPMPPELAGFEPNDFRIPTLREVLETFPDQMMNLEIKSTAPDTRPYEGTLASMLKEFGRTDDTIVASFNDRAITLFKRRNREVSTSPGVNLVTKFFMSTLGPLPGMPLPGHHSLQVPVSQNGIPIVSPDFVADAHANGLAVHVWTIDDRPTMEWLIDIGVDGIMTNRPTLLEQVLQERG